MKNQILKNIQNFIIQEPNPTMYASWKHPLYENLEPGYLIHQNGSFFCVGMQNSQEKQPGDFGKIYDLSLDELERIEKNLYDSCGFIGDLTDFIDFYNSALPDVNSTKFYNWCQTGVFE